MIANNPEINILVLNKTVINSLKSELEVLIASGFCLIQDGITNPTYIEKPRTNKFLEQLRLTYCSVDIPTAAGNEHATTNTPPITGSGTHNIQAPILGEIPE